MPPPNRYRLSCLVVLSIHARITESDVSAILPGDVEASRIRLAYPGSLRLDPGAVMIPTPQASHILIEFTMLFGGDEDVFREWLTRNALDVIRDQVLPRVNHVLLATKVALRDLFETAPIRNVGELDLLFISLQYGGEGYMARGTAGLGLNPLGDRSRPLPEAEQLAAVIPTERAQLLRAVDLTHFGFASEAVLVAFALLDAKVHDFVVSRLPNLDADEAATVIDAIESARLRMYLGPVMKLAVGASPLDDSELSAALTRLNRLRNDIVHRGEPCSPAKAQAALNTVHTLLMDLNSHGAELDLPEKLEFWTNWDDA